jgi:outer membrane protein assembly factor BamB
MNMSLGKKTVDQLVFQGFNKQVVAVDRYDGSVTWTWKASNGSGLVCLLLDGDRLIASCSGYMWCLDPLTGGEVWEQPLKGMGTGFSTLTSVRGSTTNAPSAASQVAAQHAAAAGAAAAAGGGAAAGAG